MQNETRHKIKPGIPSIFFFIPTCLYMLLLQADASIATSFHTDAS